MELSSPPKPTRIVDCLMPDAAEGTTSPQAEQTTRHHEVVSEQVGAASQMEAASLPALAGEVAVAQKQQISELSKKQEILDELKEKTNQVQLKIKSVKEEIAVVSRKVYLTQDEVSTKKARCEELDREILDLIASQSILTKQLAMASDKLERDSETYKQYQTKMATYAKQVEQYELDCPSYHNKAEQKARNAKIAEELKRLRSFGYESRIESLRAEEVQEKNHKKQLEESAAALKQSEIQKEHERHRQMNRETQTLQRRDQNRDKAQMTRKLKRRLQQALSRNQLQSDKAHSGLRQNIAEVESKLDMEGQEEDDEACQLALDIAELDSKMDE